MLGRANKKFTLGVCQSEKQELKLAPSLCDSGSITNYRAPIIRKSRGKTDRTFAVQSHCRRPSKAADLIGDGWTGVSRCVERCPKEQRQSE
jgi:hypothetical protein